MFDRINNIKIDFEKTTSINDIPEEMNREFNEVVFESLEDCKAMVREGGIETVFSSIDKEIKVQWLQEYLKTILDRMMFGYYSLEPLRKMEENDVLSLVGFVNDIFDNCIIRNNITFSEKYEEYGLETEEQMIDISLTFRTLIRFYVIHRYTQNSIIIDFVEETGLNESIAKLVAETIEKNYNQLQMAVLLEQLANK